MSSSDPALVPRMPDPLCTCLSQQRYLFVMAASCRRYHEEEYMFSLPKRRSSSEKKEQQKRQNREPRRKETASHQDRTQDRESAKQKGKKKLYAKTEPAFIAMPASCSLLLFSNTASDFYPHNTKTITTGSFHPARRGKT